MLLSKTHGFFVKPGAPPQPAFGRLWVRAWFTEIVLRKVCVCTYLSMYLCLSVRTHMSKTFK